jgi:hypothetical protein
MNRLLSFFFLITITLVSCTKDTDGGDGAEQVQLTLNVDEARPLQILSAEITGTSVQAMSYSGTIGEVEVAFYPSNEQSSNSLVCLVPENVGTGIQTLIITVNGQNLSANINVLPNESIVTPADVFDEFYADYTTSEYIDFIDEVEFQDALDVLRALPEGDRLIAAQMLANNRMALDNIALTIANAQAETGLSFGKTQSCDILCVIGTASVMVGAFLSAPIATAVGVGIIAGLVVRALKPVVTALWNKLATGLGMAIRLGYDRMAYITELVYDAADQMISNKVEEVPDTIYLENGSVLRLAIKTVREPLISEENRAQYTEVGSFLDLYYRLQNFLAGTEYQIPSLESGEVADFTLDLDDFSISVDNPLVDASAILGTPELAEVSFDSPVDGAHIFNFTYTYTNDEGTASNFTQTVRLLNISEYTTWSGNGMSFSDDHKLSCYGSTNSIDPNLLLRSYSLSLGNFWQVNDPVVTGIVWVNQLEFDISEYNGPGVYSSTSTFSVDNDIRDVYVRNNFPFDKDTGNWLSSNTDYCTYGELNYATGHNSTVTVTDQEVIGPYLVLEGTFSISLTNESTAPPNSCALPVTFTGDFRVSADTR